MATDWVGQVHKRIDGKNRKLEVQDTANATPGHRKGKSGKPRRQLVLAALGQHRTQLED